MKIIYTLIFSTITLFAFSNTDSLNQNSIIEISSPKEILVVSPPEIKENSIEAISSEKSAKKPIKISKKKLEKIVKKITKQVQAEGETTAPAKNDNVAGFILGLLSLPMVFVFPPIGFILGLLGLIISSQNEKKSNKVKLAKAGFVLSIIGLSLGLLFSVLYLVALLAV